MKKLVTRSNKKGIRICSMYKHVVNSKMPAEASLSLIISMHNSTNKSNIKTASKISCIYQPNLKTTDFINQLQNQLAKLIKFPKYHDNRRAQYH